MRDEEQYGKVFPSTALNKDREGAYGWIQWKGTDVCMDVHCQCGEQMHVDAAFLYHVKCPHCGRVYECSGYIDLIAVDGAAVERYGTAPYLLDK